MSKKTIILIGVIVIVLFFVLFVFLMATLNRDTTTTTTNPGFENPFGNESPTVPRNQPSRSEPTVGSLGETGVDPLWRVSAEPVAAATVYTQVRNNEPYTYVRYVERGTGHIFESEVTLRKPLKLSNTTIPHIQEASWFPSDPDSLIIRYLNNTNTEIQTFMARIIDDDDKKELELTDEDRVGTKRLEGSFLPDDIVEIAPSPHDTSVFYMVLDNNKSKGIVRTPEGESATVFNSPLREFRPQWVHQNLVTATTKASEEAPGFYYHIDLVNKEATLNISGETSLLTNTNPPGDTILHYTNTDRKPLLRTFSNATGFTWRVPFITLPEKCVWSRLEYGVMYCAVPNTIPTKNYPDGWYQGTLTFSDTLWRIDSLNNEIIELAGPAVFDAKGAPEGVDAVDLNVHQDERILTFINKKDGSLWAFSLKHFWPSDDEDTTSTNEEKTDKEE